MPENVLNCIKHHENMQKASVVLASSMRPKAVPVHKFYWDNAKDRVLETHFFLNLEPKVAWEHCKEYYYKHLNMQQQMHSKMQKPRVLYCYEMFNMEGKWPNKGEQTGSTSGRSAFWTADTPPVHDIIHRQWVSLSPLIHSPCQSQV